MTDVLDAADDTYLFLSPTKYLFFLQLVNPKLKTGVWSVLARRSGYKLGEIRWYAPWRQYCFWPSPETIFNVDCMVEIGDRVEKCNRWQRERRGAR